MDKAKICCALTSLQARFALADARNRLADLGEQLFSQAPDIQIQLPDMDSPAQGEEVFACLRKRQEQRSITGSGELHIFHTPVYHVPESGAPAFAAWESYGYRIDRTGRTSTACTTQFEAEFVLENDSWKFRRIWWRVIQVFVPQTYTAAQVIPPAADSPVPAGGMLPEAADYLTIRNLSNLLAVRNWHGAEELFAPYGSLELQDLTDGPIHGKRAIGEWAVSMHKYETENGGCYRCLLLAGPGDILLQNDRQAKGVWMVETFEVIPAIPGGERQIRRRICTLEQEFIRSDGSWYIQRCQMNTLAELPLCQGSGNKYERMTCPQGNWIPIAYDRTVRSSLPCFEAESLFALWPIALHRGELTRYFQNYIKNDAVPYRLHIRSQGPHMPPLEDEISIMAKLSGMDKCFLPRQPGYHCASTPVIEVDETGTRVRASWIDHSLTNMGQAFGTNAEDGSVPYMIFVSRYDHVFHQISGKWYLTSFFWEPCLSLPNWAYRLENDEGLAVAPGDGQYPLPLGLTSLADYRGI